ncbi:Peptidase T [Pantoea agglomerans]|uniref:Peptidase T n=1 Tax=Enterobacter agglomerans TaxID=549 RepID=A0A379AFL1_ENTAG|nr:Peptidase T [Pantoea agglomerans]
MTTSACLIGSRPRSTPEGREGYIWFNEIQANASKATLKASIRDFDLTSFAARKQQLQQAAEDLAARYPTGKVNVSISDTYSNISKRTG